MIDFEQAQALLAQAASPLGREQVDLGSAHRRVLAAPVHAFVDSPAQNVSAMDGYALREADLADPPATLAIAGESFAGRGFAGELPRGQCVRIFTGAPVPEGADRVVIQEEVRRDEGFAIFERSPEGARHIRKRGADFAAGDLLLDAGSLLDPRALVVAAGADCNRLEVLRQPRILVVSTGDELAEPGSARSRPGTIPESVAPGVSALAQEWDALAVGSVRLADDLDAMHRAVPDLLERADLLVVTGGASVGDRDFAKAMFEPGGLDLVFSKVAIKPGKPVWLGRAGGKLILGLPGNPTSAMVTARLFLAPLLAALSGRAAASALSWRKSILAADLPATGDRETFVRAKSTPLGAQPVENQDSGAQLSLRDADLLIRCPANSPAVAAGATVEVIDF